MIGALILLVVIMIEHSMSLITTGFILFLILLVCLRLLIHEISNSIKIKK